MAHRRDEPCAVSTHSLVDDEPPHGCESATRRDVLTCALQPCESEANFPQRLRGSATRTWDALLGQRRVGKLLFTATSIDSYTR